jgi:hypothetical protein
MTKRSVLCVLTMAVALILPADASATWAGGKCSVSSEDHCYGVASWEMSGSGEGGGEEVKGLSSEIITSAMQVPLWYEGDFVDDEQWMTGKYGHWVEDGQTAGNNVAEEEGREVNGTSLHWFYAYDNGSYNEYVAPWTYEGWTPIQYTLWDPENNGSWCEKIEKVQVACQSGFRKYATTVEVGMEAADEEAPENAGWVHSTGVQHLDGNWYTWNKAEWETVNYHRESVSAYVCTVGYQGIAAYVDWATPNNKCFS